MKQEIININYATKETLKSAMSQFIEQGYNIVSCTSVERFLDGRQSYLLIVSEIEKPKQSLEYHVESISLCEPGVYRVYFKDGRTTVASIGYYMSGIQWICPCDSVSDNKLFLSDLINSIDKIVLIDTK